MTVTLDLPQPTVAEVVKTFGLPTIKTETLDEFRYAGVERIES